MFSTPHMAGMNTGQTNREYRLEFRYDNGGRKQTGHGLLNRIRAPDAEFDLFHPSIALSHLVRFGLASFALVHVTSAYFALFHHESIHDRSQGLLSR